MGHGSVSLIYQTTTLLIFTSKPNLNKFNVINVVPTYTEGSAHHFLRSFLWIRLTLAGIRLVIPYCCQDYIIKPWCQCSAQMILNYNPEQSVSPALSVQRENEQGHKAFSSKYVRATDCLLKIFGLNTDFSLNIFGLIWISVYPISTYYSPLSSVCCWILQRLFAVTTQLHPADLFGNSQTFCSFPNCNILMRSIWRHS